MLQPTSRTAVCKVDSRYADAIEPVRAAYAQSAPAHKHDERAAIPAADRIPLSQRVRRDLEGAPGPGSMSRPASPSVTFRYGYSERTLRAARRKDMLQRAKN